MTLLSIPFHPHHVLTPLLRRSPHTARKCLASPANQHCRHMTSSDSSHGVGEEEAPVKYQRIPSHGTHFTVGYVDVGPADGPLFLGCHGVPGSAHHFQALYPALTAAGIRILVPEFPGYGNTDADEPHVFDETTSSRAALIQDFLKALNIKRVDMVAGHSVGGFTALALAANTDMCHSLTHLSGLGLRPHQAVSPYWLSKAYASLLRNPISSPLVGASLKYMYNRRGFQVEKADGLLTGMLTVDGFDYPLIGKSAERVRDKQLPALFTATQSDRICEWPLQLQLAHACGLHDNHVTYYDDSETITRGPDPGDSDVYPKGVFFERGGHVVFKTHTDIVADCIIRLIQHLHR